MEQSERAKAMTEHTKKLPCTIPASPELLALLEQAKLHVMTAEEAEAQRQSWVRGEMRLEDE